MASTFTNMFKIGRGGGGGSGGGGVGGGGGGGGGRGGSTNSMHAASSSAASSSSGGISGAAGGIGGGGSSAAAAAAAFPLNLIAAVQMYVQKMLEVTTGVKILLVDDETVRAPLLSLSLLCACFVVVSSLVTHRHGRPGRRMA